MGHPKKQRKKYETPKKPWDKRELESERKVLQDFGLRRKHEIWRSESILREFRRRARELQAKKNEKKEKEMYEKLNKMGMNCSRLDDVLSIKLEDILSRRLQTIVYKKGLANTQRHARQLIVHGHVIVGGTKIMWPSYIVRRGEEGEIALNQALAAKMIKEEVKKGKGE
ncbi:MAG: 30S ribosomal protein S4 [Candidatus Aenigmarchaeota archaeon]|nr:30S ribosomal protein S4 [Candidatus Aenigmarchaeota archaeon]